MKKLKPLTFIPLIFMLSIIFSFSAQSGEKSGKLSYKISYKIIEVKNDVFNEGKTEDEIATGAKKIHLYVRKAAHMTEYFILCVTILFPLYMYGLRGIKLFLAAIILSAVFAGLDEYHQSFVDGRGPSVKDVLIDSSGAFIAGLIWISLIKIKEHFKLKIKAGHV